LIQVETKRGVAAFVRGSDGGAVDFDLGLGHRPLEDQAHVLVLPFLGSKEGGAIKSRLIVFVILATDAPALPWTGVLGGGMWTASGGGNF
jgi:hypothetical protein